MSVNDDPLILVTGASGRTGQAVVRALARRGAKVRAFIRRAEAARGLQDIGAAQTHLGDLADDASLAAAIRGTTQVLHICPPMHPQEDTLAIKIIDLCKAAGVARLTLYSVLHPHIEVPHHRRKQRAEAALIASGLPFTILQPGRYMQHLVGIWKEVVVTGRHRMPFSVSEQFSLVDLDDLAEATAIVLTEPGHAFATYELCGPQALSQTDCAKIIGDALKRTVVAEAKPLDDVIAEATRAGWPQARIDNMAIMNRHYDAHGFRGNPRVLRWLIEKEPATFADFVGRLAAAPAR